MRDTTLTISRDELDAITMHVVAYRGSYVSADRMLDMLGQMKRTATLESAWMGNTYTRQSFADAFAMEGFSDTSSRMMAEELFGQFATAKGNVIAAKVAAAQAAVAKRGNLAKGGCYIVSVQNDGELYPVEYGPEHRTMAGACDLAKRLSNGIGRAPCYVNTCAGTIAAEGIVVSDLVGGALVRFVDGCEATCK